MCTVWSVLCENNMYTRGVAGTIKVGGGGGAKQLGKQEHLFPLYNYWASMINFQTINLNAHTIHIPYSGIKVGGRAPPSKKVGGQLCPPFPTPLYTAWSVLCFQVSMYSGIV